MNRPPGGRFFFVEMKYRQLTTEQLDELHDEFSKFLATQQIDVNEWKEMKMNKPNMAMEEINIFSDIVWEEVLTKAEYLDHFSEKHINLFKCTSKEILRIHIKMIPQDRNFLNPDDFQGFLKDPTHESIEYFRASKKYDNERNSELFSLIEMGAQISDGQLFKQIAQLISP